ETVSKACRSEKVLTELADRLVVLDDMAQALLQSIPGPLGRELMNSSTSLPKKLFKALQLDFWESDEFQDKQQDAMVEYLEMCSEYNPRFQDVRAPSAELLNVRIRLSGSRWREWPRMRTRIANHLFSRFGPIITGNVEQLPNLLKKR